MTYGWWCDDCNEGRRGLAFRSTAEAQATAHDDEYHRRPEGGNDE
jgi:hypothetical protein